MPKTTKTAHLTLKTAFFSTVRDIFKGPYRSFAWTVTVVMGIFLIVWIVGPGNTFVSWIRAKRDISSMERQIRDYEQRSAEMDSRINELRSNLDSLEKFAREKFYFSAPCEDIYIIDDK